MKIIAKTTGGYLVEVDEAEIAMAAGFAGTWDAGWQKDRPAIDPYRRDSGLRIGAAINVRAAFTFHSRVASGQEKAREAAGSLRALANLLDGALPDVVLPPSAPTEDEAAQ